MCKVIIPDINSSEYGSVANKKYYRGPGINVGRPSIFGNPFTHLPVGITRAETQVRTIDEAVQCYKNYAIERAKRDLDFRNGVIRLCGRKLICWCVDEQGKGICHAWILLELGWQWKKEDAESQRLLINFPNADDKKAFMRKLVDGADNEINIVPSSLCDPVSAAEHIKIDWVNNGRG